ncbi:MAG: 1-phosphofructokinase family hexose kinase [Acidovorax sp.]|nr:1-phosphofructokinase family hexose kinase [Acidovorax sp.]
MTHFFTLTLNPALDIATSTEQVQATHKLRCAGVQRYPGGGGINVARVLHRLGAPVQAWALAGGPAGAQLQQLLAREGVPTLVHPITGDTRENLSVLETCTGREFRFVLPGPTVGPADWQAGLELLRTPPPITLPAAPHWVIASGSLPPGVPDDFYAQAARLAKAQGRHVVLDTSGPPLAAALQAGVTLVKPSLRELRELLQQPLASLLEQSQAAQSLVLRGAADMVALSMGEDGALLATRHGVWQAPALNVPAATGTTGAGDCFLATLVWALAQGDAPPDALRWGVAAGAAALLAPGTALAQREEILRLLATVPVPQAVASPG